jgi:hypothetical protein
VFTQLSLRADMYDFRPIIEKNENVILRKKSILGGTNTYDYDFYPFDPYSLTESKKYIQPIYKKWESPKSMETNIKQEMLSLDSLAGSSRGRSFNAKMILSNSLSRSQLSDFEENHVNGSSDSEEEKPIGSMSYSESYEDEEYVY